MADLSNYPPKYLLLNDQMSKNLAITLEIEDVPDIYGISQTFETVRYGQPGLVYGLPGLVYGGLRTVASIKPYIVLDASLTIGQKIEPERGKGNIGTITVTLIDYKGEVSHVIAPGIVVPEILAKQEVKLWLGFRQTSFPEDYLLIYRGYLTSVQCPPGLVRFQLSDSTTKVRQPLFDTPTTILLEFLDETTTVIPVVSTQDFFQQILGPDGTYDPNIRTFIRIDDEIMEYLVGGLSETSITVLRGALGTVAVAHDLGQSVSNSVLIGDFLVGMNAIEIALKTYLSGWNGPSETDVPIASIAYDGTGIPNTSIFSLGNNSKGKPIYADKDLGLTAGDYFTISGATNPANNVTGIITLIEDPTDVRPNSIITVDQVLTLEPGTSAVSSYRSKYDTFPVGCGLKMRMRDVDVETIEFVKRTYFTAASSSNMRFYMDAPISGLEFINLQIYLPLGCYGISRFGRVSLSVTKPPLPGIGKLLFLDWTNILDPQNITVTRATNSRSFYNLISFKLDKDFLTGEYETTSHFLDTNSLNAFGQTSVLPIDAPGITTEIGSTLIASRGRALLNRYKNCVITIELSVNWSVGSLIEVSDIVVVTDNGKLQIMNFETGERNLGVQLFEVIDRQYNIVSGNVKLKLLGGLGFTIDSRFGLFSPSSLIAEGATATQLPLQPSFGQTDILIELSKWTPFIGLPIQIHSSDYTFNETVTLVSIVGTSLIVDPPLSVAPPAGTIVDINSYSNSPAEGIYRTLYAHISPSVSVVDGVSTTSFNVAPADVFYFFIGSILILRTGNYSILSIEVKVTSISGTLITVDQEFMDQNGGLPFIPNSTFTVEGIGFYQDQSGFYRYS